MGFIHDGRFRRHRGIGNRRRDRVALDRIHRYVNAQRLEQLGRVATQRQHIVICGERARIGTDAADFLAAALNALDRRVKAKLHAQRLRHLGQILGEFEAVAGFIAWQAQGADKLLLDQR